MLNVKIALHLTDENVCNLMLLRHFKHKNFETSKSFV